MSYVLWFFWYCSVIYVFQKTFLQKKLTHLIYFEYTVTEEVFCLFVCLFWRKHKENFSGERKPSASTMQLILATIFNKVLLGAIRYWRTTEFYLKYWSLPGTKGKTDKKLFIGYFSNIFLIIILKEERLSLTLLQISVRKMNMRSKFMWRLEEITYLCDSIAQTMVKRCFLFLFFLSFSNTDYVLFGKGHTFLMRDLIKYSRFVKVNILHYWI